MPSLVSAKERQELLPLVTTVICPSCGAAIGEKCVYKNNARRGGEYHFTRFLAVKKATAQAESKYGVKSDDMQPLASRRLTLREMRDAGIWVPLKSENQ